MRRKQIAKSVSIIPFYKKKNYRYFPDTPEFYP